MKELTGQCRHDRRAAGGGISIGISDHMSVYLFLIESFFALIPLEQ